MEKGQNDMLFTPSGCLSEQGITLFTGGQLPEEELNAVKTHLLGCELCAMAAEGFILAGPDALTEDISLLNAAFTGLTPGDKLDRETSILNENADAEPRLSAAYPPENRPSDGGLRSSKDERQFNDADKETPVKKTRAFPERFRQSRFRLMAATLLLLAGFGSVMLYQQLRHTPATTETAGLIEAADTNTPLPPSARQLYMNQTVRAEREKSVQFSEKKADTLTLIHTYDQDETTATDITHHPVAGLIDKGSYSGKESNGFIPSQGIPQAATPVIQPGTDTRVLSLTEISEREENPSETVVKAETLAVNENKRKATVEKQEIELIQGEEDEEMEIFSVVEESPHFPGGEEKRKEFFQENLRYPQEAKEALISGKVYVTFVVEVDGSITDARVLKGIGGGCDEEAIRVVKMMPGWVPGKQRGKPVRVQFSLTVDFKLAG